MWNEPFSCTSSFVINLIYFKNLLKTRLFLNTLLNIIQYLLQSSTFPTFLGSFESRSQTLFETVLSFWALLNETVWFEPAFLIIKCPVLGHKINLPVLDSFNQTVVSQFWIFLLHLKLILYFTHI